MEQISENHEIGNLGSQIYFVWVATNSIWQILYLNWQKSILWYMVFFGMKFKCLIFCQGFSHWKGKWLYVHQRIWSSQYFGRSWNNGYEHLKLFVCIFFNCLFIDFIFLLICLKNRFRNYWTSPWCWSRGYSSWWRWFNCWMCCGFKNYETEHSDHCKSLNFWLIFLTFDFQYSKMRLLYKYTYAKNSSHT